MKKTLYIYFSVDIVHKKCQKESHEKYKSDEIKAGFGIGDVQSHTRLHTCFKRHRHSI